MPVTHALKREQFRALHHEGCFVIPNPWDVGGARRLEKLGFKALASTGAGYAWSLGREDGQLTLDESLGHLRTLCAATDLPVNADFEGGYADDPEGVFKNVLLAIDTGVAGLSIEDRKGRELIDFPRAVERVRAARRAIDQSGQDVLLIGRSEGHFIGKPDLEATIGRLVAYSQAGADCLFAPGVTDLSDIARIVAAVRPKPVNVMITGPWPAVSDLAVIGVRRVSVGGSLAIAAWRGFDMAAQMLLAEGKLPPRP
ncbi:MAG TPA: isocitrate lyase/phosphoenolpyruvate mutase family protein [Bradyrhizobium sp.]|nr:isocitrate lyase/phosphoenolpyruvate mutase family protein [Bradyrhizobium sp.]